MSMENGDNVVIVLIGPAGSGKGTVATYLQEKHHIPTTRYSTIFREVLRILCIPETRPEISKISLGLRKLYAEDVLAAPISSWINTQVAPIVVLDGARRKEDISSLETNRKIISTYIEAPATTRLNRISQRTENEDDATKTVEAFEKDEAHDTEVTIPPLKAIADYTIINDGSLEALYSKVDTLLTHISHGH